jgi:hypothetical protein
MYLPQNKEKDHPDGMVFLFGAGYKESICIFAREWAKIEVATSF